MATNDRYRRRLTRLLAGVGLAAGIALLTRPRQVVGRLAPAFPADRLWLARALGARLLVQHGAVLALPDHAMVRVGSAVDLMHAASMVPFVVSPSYGRAARLSGGFAAAYAAIGLAVAPRSEGR